MLPSPVQAGREHDKKSYHRGGNWGYYTQFPGKSQLYAVIFLFGGSQQIGARIAYNEMDMVLFFVDPNDSSMEKELLYISRLCDQNYFKIEIQSTIKYQRIFINAAFRPSILLAIFRKARAA